MTRSLVRRMPNGSTLEARFYNKVRGGSIDECWLWIGARIYSGYGLFNDAPHHMTYAHRWAYEFMVADIPEGLELDHLCRVRNCVNVFHLEPVTRAENSLRRRKPFCDLGHPEVDENISIRRAGRYVYYRCRTCANARVSQRRRDAA
jgi:hypothetical protein